MLKRLFVLLALASGIASDSVAQVYPGNPFGNGLSTTASQLGWLSVTDFGADPTGVVAMDTAFNNAMAKCYQGLDQIRQLGTVYIPAGFYSVTSGLNWKQNCNIFADHAAYIKVNASITALLSGTTGSANTLENTFLYGGQWDCNGNTTDGFRLPDFFEMRLSHFNLFNCNSASGGAIHLGTNTANTQGNAFIDFFEIYNYTGTHAAGNSGIFTDSGNTHGISDTVISNGIIEGVDTAVNMLGGGCSSCIYDTVHTFNFSGAMANAFVFNGNGPAIVNNSQADSPIASGGACFTFNTTGNNRINRIANSGCLESINDNFVKGVSLGAVNLSATGNEFVGVDGSHRIASDFSGTLTGLYASANRNSNVVTVGAGGSGMTKNAPGTLASLGTCNASSDGTYASITDGANALTAFNQVAVGSGTRHQSVYCNGSSWIVLAST